MKNKMEKYRHIYVSILVVIGMLFSVCITPIHGKNKLIKVAFPIQEGLTMKEDNKYTGYTYDYLKELAQYTDWEYEFVEVEGDINQQLTTLMEMLKEGKIDIMGGMAYNDALAQTYDFASNNYGNVYNVIAVSLEHGKIDEYTLTSKKVKVALFTKATTRNEAFFQYASVNAIDYEIVWCQDDNDRNAKIESGEADVFVDIDLNIENKYRSIAKFAPTPFYFATTKGNTQLIRDLNGAMNNIDEINPTLEDTLYNTYFEKQADTLFLTPLEKEYIRNKKTLTVLVRDGYAPIQYINDEGNVAGIGNDVLKNIQEKTGLELEYVFAKDYEEYVSLIKEQKVDMILSMQYEYDIAKELGVTLSNPYIEGNEVVVNNKKLSGTNIEDKIIAVSKEYSSMTDKLVAKDKIRYYDNAKECLDAVESGKCDYYYGDSYTVPYYQNLRNYDNINTLYTSNQKKIRYSFGLVKEDNVYLATIINKSIRIIQKQNLDEYIYVNAQQKVEFSLWNVIKENWVVSIIVIMSLISAFICAVYIYYRNQMRLKKKVELEYKRYRSLSEVMKEIIFEYNYVQDTLKLSKEAVDTFGSQGIIENYFIVKDQQHSKEMFYQCLLKKEDTDCDIEMQLVDGSSQWYHIVMKVIKDNEQVVYAIGRLKNIQQEKMDKDLLLKKSTMDYLTNVYNGETCKKNITEILENDIKHTHALCMIDVDCFKNINDTYGHYTGDQVLVKISDYLKKSFEHDGIIGRIGGDEFLVFLPNILSQEQVEEKIRSLITRIANDDGKSLEVALPTISVGIALIQGKSSYVEVFKKADEMLYKAKKSGRNMYYTAK